VTGITPEMPTAPAAGCPATRSVEERSATSNVGISGRECMRGSGVDGLESQIAK
jgi:hypothetical protein